MKKKGGRPRHGKDLTRNQIKVILPDFMLEKLVARAGNKNKSVSGYVGEILLENFFSGAKPPATDKTVLDSIQVTINGAIYRKLEEVATSQGTSCIAALAYYLKKELGFED